MSQFASRYQRLSVQDTGFLDLKHSGLPQHVAILAVAEGGRWTTRMPAYGWPPPATSSAAACSWSPECASWCCAPRLGKGLPLWVDDPAFGLANHLRAVQVAAPGGERELLRLCDELCPPAAGPRLAAVEAVVGNGAG